MALSLRIGVILLASTVLIWLSLASSAAQQLMELTPAKIEAFVAAALAADQVEKRWEPRIDGAGTEAEAARLQEQADADMINSINSIDNMTVEEYRAIYVAAQADPNLANLLTELFRERVDP